MTTIDLNCDLGESFGPWEMGNDAAMIELATSVNVACGFHAGDADIMRHTVELAKARAGALMESREALTGLIDILAQTGRADEGQKLIDGMSAEQKASIGGRSPIALKKL